ncbi:MAG: DUF11 domain-containing protein [Chloroflexi bacterium]|nr:DUF11 domain-containing protein [Chloroflexota bacterium]MCI0579364.1 DUF11 domain-containing protein [Chloroflexota bacterium]MCI0646212.1 DUF11 domain-containing protein [Chloroflexota bacterium]MCI0726917.1 DUF11 domain-containing protein [Chloroflexota bacterium]
MQQPKWFKLSLVVALALSCLLFVGVALADGPDNGARGGVPDNTPPAEDPEDLSEGFDDITTLPGAGWFSQNNSQPLGVTGWFQGNSAVFPAQGGAATSYLGANFNNTAGTGTISNWMLTPVLNLNDGDTMTFWTRTVAQPNPYPDRLQVRMSLNGASTNVGTLATDVGDFTTLLLDINPTYVVGGYPEAWTQFVINITGAPTPTNGRLAFRYFVENGGPTGANSNYIGIDTFDFTDGVGASVAISKSPDTQNVVSGGNANFTISVTNTGGLTLTNVTVSDAAVSACDNVFASLAPGANQSYNCSDVGVTISYTNTAVVTSTVAAGPGPTDSDDAFVNVVPPTGVSLSEFGGQQAVGLLPVWLGAAVVLAAGLAVALRRKRPA